jgi:hypothetical protein
MMPEERQETETVGKMVYGVIEPCIHLYTNRAMAYAIALFVYIKVRLF